MRLTRASSLVQRLAGRRFTNRYGSFQVFKRGFELLKSNSTSFRVISFYGVGGIGKTALLKELFRKNSSDDVRWIRIDLESSMATNAVEVLYEVYRESGIRDFLLEYTLALIWEHRGRSISDIRNRIVAVDGPIAEVAELAFGAVEAMIGAKTVRKIFEASVDTYREKYGQFADQIQLVNDATESEREQILVEFMAAAIKKQAEKGQRFVISVDSLHWMEAKTGFSSGERQCDDWLLDLIGNAQTGLWLLTSREKLKWAEEIPAWSSVLDEHLLGRLSDDDCETFLQGVPVTQREIRDKITKDSRGIPIFLDLCVSLYLSVSDRLANPTVDDFDFDPTQLVKRYLSHLERSHAQAVEVLSLLDEVDQRIALALFRAFELPISVRDYNIVCDSMLALPLDQDFGEFRIHSDLRETIVRGLSRKEIALAFDTLVKLVWELVLENPDRTRDLAYASWLFARILSIKNSQIVEANGETASKLFLAGYRLMEAGNYDVFSNEVDASSADWTTDSDEVTAAIEALAAYASRRRGDLKTALIKWRKLDGLKGVEFSAPMLCVTRYLKAHTEHLLGNYDAACEQYENIIKKFSLHDEPHLQLARRQLADIDMLKGRFRRAENAFNSELAHSHEPIWSAEVFRHLGHLYRFNFLLDEARSAYRSAEKISLEQEADIISAKLLTNQIELDAFRAPQDAVELFEKAISENLRFENYIEVGKCKAAIGVAYARLGAYDEALKQIESSMEIQARTGYRSGTLFALTSKSYLEMTMGDTRGGDATLKQAVALSEDLKVYSFFPAFAQWKLAGNIEELMGVADWLKPDGLHGRICKLNL